MNAPADRETDRRRHRTWGERFLLEPVFFWLDLYGADGRPSHHKVLSAWGYFVGLGAEVWMLSKASSLSDVSWPFVFLVLATLAIPMGKDVFKAVLGVRINGNGSAPRSPAPSSAPASQPKGEAL